MRRLVLVVLCVALCVGGLSARADAAGTPVPCDSHSLIVGFIAVVNNPGPDVLSLSPGCTYVLRNDYGAPDGLPQITDELTLHGNGATILRNSTEDFRIFNLYGTVTIDHLTIEGGSLPYETTTGTPGQDGAGILNVGTLTLRSVNLVGNVAGTGALDAAGGNGGGIYNAGTLRVIGSRFASNSGGQGGASTSSGGAGGNGGAIYNAVGATATVIGSRFTNNTAGDGRSGNSQGGAGGLGGAIYNAGTLKVTRSRLLNNSAGEGAFAPTPGVGGSGGGILNDLGGLATVSTSTLAHNAAGTGGTNSSMGADGGSGGGIVNNDTLNISRSKIISNRAGAGGIGSTLNGNTGSGGGIFSGVSIVHAVKTKVKNNTPDNCAPPGSVTHCSG